MKRIWSRKKNNRLSRLVTLTLCVVCLFGTNGVPLTAFAETETSGLTEANTKLSSSGNSESNGNSIVGNENGLGTSLES